MNDPTKRLDALKRQIKGDPDDLKDHEEPRDVNDSDRDTLLDFDRRLRLLDSEYGDHRREKLMRHCTLIAENVRPGVLTEALDSRGAAEDIVLWVKSEYDNEYTKKDFRVALRVFGKRVTDDGVNDDPDKPPASID